MVTRSEVESLAAMPLPKHILAQQGEPVRGALLQGVDVEGAVLGQELGDYVSLVAVVGWAVRQVTARQSGNQFWSLCLFQ